MGKIISIDLGTTNSAVAVIEGGKCVVIPNSEGKNTTPSVVAFTKSGERIVGDPARRQGITNPKNTITSIKRFMGEKFSNTKLDRDRHSYSVVSDENDNPRIDIDGRLYSPQEISAMILQKMKKTAEDYLGTTVTEAVITVPAFFNDSQRQATKESCEISGMVCKRIINEPTAASLAFNLDKDKKDKKIAVFDLGGGTMDITVLEVGGGVFEVKSTSGNCHLGGDDIDQIIIDFLADDFQNEFNLDLRKDPMALQRLKEAAEKAKIELSSTMQVELNLPYIMPVDGIPKHLVKTLTRAKFEQMIESFIKQTIEPCKIALKESGFDKNDIDEVILVGGSTRIPAIQNAVEQFFGKKPNKSVNPDEAVAIGAAVQASILAGETQDVLLLDVTPLSLGIRTMGDVFTKLVEANTTIPTEKSQIFTTATDNQSIVSIHVGQGERPMFDQNKMIGKFDLDGIPPARRGTPQILVSFSIDADGILKVSAKDNGTGKEQHITIQSSSGLSQEEIDRMKKEAEENAAADKEKMDKVLAMNKADSMVFSSEKQLEEMGEKLTDEEKSKVQAVLDEIKDVIKTQSHDKVDELETKLNQVWIPISARLYSKENPDGGNSSNPFAGFGGDNPFSGAGGFDFNEMMKNAKKTAPSGGEFAEEVKV